MNVKALTLAAISAGVAVATFVALNLVAPITHAAEHREKGVTADQVFAASIAEPGASAPAAAAAAPSTKTVETAATAPAQPATEVAMAAAEEPAAAPTEAAAPAPASEPAAAVTGGGACSTGVVEPGKKPVVVMASGLPGDAPAPVKVAAAAPAEPAVESAPEPAVASAPAAMPEPAVEASAEPTPAPAPKPKAKSKPKAIKVPAEAKTAWWPAKTSGKLNLTYAGEASFTKAIVLLFDGTFDSADSANQNIKVSAKNGGKVKGPWKVATGNKQMLLLDVAPGLYNLEVGTGLTDKGNRAISAASSGVVFIP